MQYLTSLQNVSIKICADEILSTLLNIYDNYMFNCDFRQINLCNNFKTKRLQYDDVDIRRYTQLAFLQLYLIGSIMRGDGYHIKYSDEAIKRYISTCVACKPSQFSILSGIK